MIIYFLLIGSHVTYILTRTDFHYIVVMYYYTIPLLYNLLEIGDLDYAVFPDLVLLAFFHFSFGRFECNKNNKEAKIGGIIQMKCVMLFYFDSD